MTGVLFRGVSSPNQRLLFISENMTLRFFVNKEMTVYHFWNPGQFSGADYGWMEVV